MSHSDRIQFADTIKDVMVKLCKGNPGGLRVLTEVYKQADRISRYNERTMIVLLFDSLGIYGPDIWMLYKDVCGCSIPVVVGVLRAWQLGMVTQDQIKLAIATGNENNVLDLGLVRTKVKAELDGFNFDYDDQEEANG